MGIRQFFGPPAKDTQTSSIGEEELTQLEKKLTAKLTPAITAQVQQEIFRLFPDLASMMAAASQQVHASPPSSGTLGSTATSTAAPASTPTATLTPTLEIKNNLISLITYKILLPQMSLLN